MIAAWKVPSTLYVVWANMGMARRRVAKRVRIEGEDRRGILLLCVCMCVVKMFRRALCSVATSLPFRRETIRLTESKVAVCYYVPNAAVCARAILCGWINVKYSECLQRQIANVVQVRSEVASGVTKSRCGWMDGSVYMS